MQRRLPTRCSGNSVAFNELDLKRIEKAAADFLAVRRPPPDIRGQLDLEYTVYNQTIELVEVRPVWNNPSEIRKPPFAKATYVRTANEWRIFWMRGNLKWHAYDPPVAPTIAAFFSLLHEDRFCCFFG